jgi:hypothetical protein
MHAIALLSPRAHLLRCSYSKRGTVLHPCSGLLQNGQTPLHRAAGSGRTEVVGLLLHAGAAVDAATKVTQASLELDHHAATCRGGI